MSDRLQMKVGPLALLGHNGSKARPLLNEYWLTALFYIRSFKNMVKCLKK